MKKSRFTESQIIAVLKEADAGMKVEELCRQHCISNTTYYNWKSKYGGMEAADVKRLKELEEENAELKKMYADFSLENQPLRSWLQKRVGDSRETRVRQHTGWCGAEYRKGLPVRWYWPFDLLSPRTRLAQSRCCCH